MTIIVTVMSNSIGIGNKRDKRELKKASQGYDFRR
jgi:hypothetical protein